MATPGGRSRTLVIVATSFNRRALTISALHSAERSAQSAGLLPSVVLADAGSSDGTAEAVEAEFEIAKVLRVSNEHYWAQGMRVAMASAESGLADFVLWLNDDTMLDGPAVRNLVTTSDAMPLPGLVAGAVRDAVTGERTYGGWVNSSRWGLRFTPAPVSSLAIPCDTLNGNVVLISRRVVDRVGLLDLRFTHGLADLDYGLRARRMGVPILQAPGFVGTCSHNALRGTWRDPSLSVRRRVHLMRTPKGLPPGEWVRFQLRHGRLSAPINILRPWLGLLVDAARLRSSRTRNGPADRLDRTHS